MIDVAPVAPDRISTGIEGMDNILDGGLPSHHLYLLEGPPGSGKTTLGLQFLRVGAQAGERVLYITLSESGDELNAVARSHGWTLQGIDIFELGSSNVLDMAAEQSVLHPSDLELGETTEGIFAHVNRVKPERVVLDSLSELRLLAQDSLRYRRQVLAIKRFFASRRCTVLMLDDQSLLTSDLQVHSIAHGVMTLSQTPADYGPNRRAFRINKLRGSAFRGGEHDVRLSTGGIEIFPRLVASEHRTGFEPQLRTTGNDRLDQMLGGGLAYGTSTLFMGPSGVGKTTTAISCAMAALERGEHVSYYLFDEGLGTLLARCEALGLNIRSYIEAGQLNVVQLDPGSISAGEFATLVRHAVEVLASKVLVVDSLNAYLQAMSGSRALTLQMHELLLYLNQLGVATILVLSQHGLFGEDRNEVDLSYLSDSILLFRFFEANGNLLKALSIVKSRVAKHESAIREFRLGTLGLSIGDALRDFEGVMRGVPVYRGTQPLMIDSDSVAG
ncbi:MAG: ATPase domain-containing protein [Rubrivivax sp.]